MFVSQVTFAAQDEALLRKIMKKKLQEQAVEGRLSTECWRGTLAGEPAYTLVSRWETKQHFTAWLAREEHAGAHRTQGTGGERPKIKKTAAQFEVVSADTL